MSAGHGCTVDIPSRRMEDVFDRLAWEPDRLLFDDLVFRLEHCRSGDWMGGDHFRFFKIKSLVDQYRDFFRRLDRNPSHLLELGIFDGGSTAFWYELLCPDKLVAIDIQNRVDSEYFRSFVESRGLGERVKTIWGTDQADKESLRELVQSEFSGHLDMVIDDASHLYAQTRASFEALFPFCAPGGLYIIEDWAWGHWPEFLLKDHPWSGEKRLTQLLFELIEATGTSTQLISNITVYQGFAVIERGPFRFDDPAKFNLENHIVRQSVELPLTRVANLFRGRISNLLGFLRR